MEPYECSALKSQSGAAAETIELIYLRYSKRSCSCSVYISHKCAKFKGPRNIKTSRKHFGAKPSTKVKTDNQGCQCNENLFYRLIVCHLDY